MFSEDTYEIEIIKAFQNIGYEYLSGSDMILRRKDLSTIILWDEVENALKRINKSINQEEINQVIDKIKRMDNANLTLGNKNAFKALTEGFKIYSRREEITYTYFLVDLYEVNNNNYIVTNQLKMISNHINYDNQIPDVVIYVNGIPVSVVELKSPINDESKSIADAYDQIKNYQRNLPTLFTWNIVNAISNMHISRYGSLTASYTRYSNWRNKESNLEPYKYFFETLYNKKNLITILKDFSYYVTGDELIKIVAGYHQIDGVKSAKESVLRAIKDQTGKAGIFWHTQGSGKSLSMVFLTRFVNKYEKKMTTVVVTDRKDLDNQLAQTFLGATDFLGQEVKQIESIQDLKDTLNNRIQNGVYLCTIQKFDETINQLSNRKDILIISDEAHRSHKNIHGKLAVIEDEFSVEERFGHAYYLRKAFPNGTFIGFTGTPIESEDHQTKSIFGDYSTKYLMTDATEDGFVVPISYESRHAMLEIASQKKAELDILYSEIRNEVLKNIDLKQEVQKHLNKKIQKMDTIIGDPTRIKEIANDFVKHYIARSELLKGKAMFVAYNRAIAYEYYNEIVKIKPELKENIRLILTPNNQKDSTEFLELIGSDKYRKDSAGIFKDPESDFKIAIVVDMWLTGFDAPCLDTIYIDKPIKMHNLMQTIARVNRTYTDKKNKELIKESGLVVDYIGLWSKLQDALEFYTAGGDNVTDIAPEDIQIVKARLLKYVRSIYKDDLDNEIIVDYTRTNNKSYLFSLVEDIQRIVVRKKEKQVFVNRTRKLSKGFTSVVTICSYEEKILIQLLITSRSMLIKRELGLLDIDMKVNQIKDMIADSIIHNRTVINDSFHGEKISLTSLANIIIEGSKNKDNDPLEIEKLIKATKFAVNNLKTLNVVRSERLTKKLQILIDKYDSGHLEEEEFHSYLEDLGREVLSTINETMNSGKDMVELAFFEILLDDQYSKNQYDRDMIEKITSELYTRVKPLLKKRWLHNESVKQKVRSEMKLILLKNGYPPQTTIELQNRLIKQLDEQIYGGICRLEEE